MFSLKIGTSSKVTINRVIRYLSPQAYVPDILLLSLAGPYRHKRCWVILAAMRAKRVSEINKDFKNG